MKLIYIMRHATAESNGSEGDHARILSERGREEAKLMGQYMQQHQFQPQIIFCSSAKRTVETAENVNRHLAEQVKIEPLKNLYNSTPGEILKFINGCDDSVNAIMIVAHNPGIHQLCLLLAGHISPQAMKHLKEGCPPASFAAFTFEGNWNAVEANQANLQEFVTPALVKDDG